MQELRFEDYQQGRKGKQQGGTLSGLGQLGSGLNTSVGGGWCVRTYELVCIRLFVGSLDCIVVNGAVHVQLRLWA